MADFDRMGLTRLLNDGIQQLPFSCSDVQIAQWIDYLALLFKWNATYNLTAVRNPMQMVTQHLLDCLTVAPFFAQAKNVLDVGAGGGLPGIVLAIWAAGTHSAMRFSLIDTVHKKTAFLTQVKAELRLSNVTVHTGRVEQLQVAHQFDVITSRAFADLSDFINWSGHLLAPEGCFIAMKGVAPNEEAARLPDGWQVRSIQPLMVPGLGAERHVVLIERSNEASIL
jgi:16S rRNA (guanine527-N7)-methyltransferase